MLLPQAAPRAPAAFPTVAAIWISPPSISCNYLFTSKAKAFNFLFCKLILTFLAFKTCYEHRLSLNVLCNFMLMHLSNYFEQIYFKPLVCIYKHTNVFIYYVYITCIYTYTSRNTRVKWHIQESSFYSSNLFEHKLNCSNEAVEKMAFGHRGWNQLFRLNSKPSSECQQAWESLKYGFKFCSWCLSLVRSQVH